MPVVDVMTLNVHAGMGLLGRRHVLPAIGEAIASLAPDLAFLQEVHGRNALHDQRFHAGRETPHHVYLAGSLWPHHAYGRNAELRHGHQGNALLSRFPIVDQRNHDVSITGHEPRGLLHCTLAVPGSARPLHAICVHLGLRHAHRILQLHGLLEVIDTVVPADAPLVIAGDFNDLRGKGHPMLRQHGLSEAFETAGGRLAATFPSRLPVFALDRIYLRNARATNPTVHGGRPWSRLSDHLPLSARIEF